MSDRACKYCDDRGCDICDSSGDLSERSERPKTSWETKAGDRPSPLVRDKDIPPFKPPTPEEIESIKQSAAAAAKRFRDGPPPPKDDRTGTCVVCKGLVVAKVTTAYYGDPMHRIIGPGGRNQMTTRHHGWHCESCGLRYEFPPPGDNTPPPG